MYPPELTGKDQQRHLVANQEKLGEKWQWIFLQCSLTCYKILWHFSDNFASPLKEVVLQIIIAFKNPSCLAGFEPTILCSIVKHDNHQITEADLHYLCFIYFKACYTRLLGFFNFPVQKQGCMLYRTKYCTFLTILSVAKWFSINCWISVQFFMC
jgi:hypothetical protein